MCPGTCTRLTHGSSPATSSGRLACAVTPIGPGVRHRHRDGVDADREPHAEPVDQPPDGGREPLPLHVRLGPGQHEEPGAGGVLDQAELEPGGVVGLPVVLDEQS